MSQLNLTVRTASHNVEVSVLEASGVLDINTVGEFEEAFQALFRSNRYRIVVDLSKLDYISSAGIGVLVGNLKEIRRNRGDIKFGKVNPDIYKVFDLMDLQKIFQFHPGEKEASLAF